MIEVGDLVRLKNSAIRAKGFCNPFGRTNYKRRDWRHFRGKNFVARVVRVVSDTWDWRSKKHNRIVELDIPDRHWPSKFRETLSTDWLAIVAKGKKE